MKERVYCDKEGTFIEECEYIKKPYNEPFIFVKNDIIYCSRCFGEIEGYLKKEEV